jgi:hypothetical protein
MSLLNTDLADPLLPYLDAKTMAALSRANSTFRGWARDHGRCVHLSLQYTHHSKIFGLASVKDEFPCDATDARGAPVRLQYREIQVWPIMHSTYLMAMPGKSTSIRTEKDITYGSALSRRDSVMTATLVFDDAERSPVPLIETPVSRGGWNRNADVCLAFTDMAKSSPNTVRAQTLRCINRLSSHFSPRAKMRLRITLSVARRPDGDCGDDKEMVQTWKRPDSPPAFRGYDLPKQMKPGVFYKHYHAYSPAFYTVSRVQTAESVLKRKATRARQREAASAAAAAAVETAALSNP